MSGTCHLQLFIVLSWPIGTREWAVFVFFSYEGTFWEGEGGERHGGDDERETWRGSSDVVCVCGRRYKCTDREDRQLCVTGHVNFTRISWSSFSVWLDRKCLILTFRIFKIKWITVVKTDWRTAFHPRRHNDNNTCHSSVSSKRLLFE